VLFMTLTHLHSDHAERRSAFYEIARLVDRERTVE
jgi:hypothetical protein